MRSWQRRAGCAAGGGGGAPVSMFVCGVVRFHTDGRLVGAGLHSPSYQAPNVPKPMCSFVLTSYMLLLNTARP